MEQKDKSFEDRVKEIQSFGRALAEKAKTDAKTKVAAANDNAAAAQHETEELKTKLVVSETARNDERIAKEEAIANRNMLVAANTTLKNDSDTFRLNNAKAIDDHYNATNLISMEMAKARHGRARRGQFHMVPVLVASKGGSFARPLFSASINPNNPEGAGFGYVSLESAGQTGVGKKFTDDELRRIIRFVDPDHYTKPANDDGTMSVTQCRAPRDLPRGNARYSDDNGPLTLNTFARMGRGMSYRSLQAVEKANYEYQLTDEGRRTILGAIKNPDQDVLDQIKQYDEHKNFDGFNDTIGEVIDREERKAQDFNDQRREERERQWQEQERQRQRQRQQERERELQRHERNREQEFGGHHQYETARRNGRLVEQADRRHDAQYSSAERRANYDSYRPNQASDQRGARDDAEVYANNTPRYQDHRRDNHQPSRGGYVHNNRQNDRQGGRFGRRTDMPGGSHSERGAEDPPAGPGADRGAQHDGVHRRGRGEHQF